MSLLLFKYFYQDDLAKFVSFLESGSVIGSTKRSLQVSIAGNGGHGNGGSGNGVASVKDINRVDEFGRTVLHLACSQNKIDFVRALLNFSGTDLLIADFESGWTALHRALYAGNVTISRLLIAKNRDTIRIKDREGNSPFDVLNSTIECINPFALDPLIGGSELLTFGSNANHTLGFSDGDDRANPELVLFNRPHNENAVAIDKFKKIHIKDVQMSKLHTIVLTTDSVNNVYICGFGNKGRLGLSTNGTQFTLQNLPKFGSGQVIQAAVGQDHTIVLTSSGDCFSWGSNKHGQLGYIVETKRPQDEPIQTSPKRISGGLKKEFVIGVASSNIHSVAFTETDVFMWGKNVGQLGFPLSDNQAIEYSPRKVSSVPGQVAMVTAIDTATICLMRSGDVIVYMNGGHFKVFFPLERFADTFSVFRPRGSYEKNTVVKVVSGNNTVYALSSLGDVYSFQLSGKSIQSAKTNALSKLIKPHNVWSLRRKYLAVRDLDIGQDNSVIICTAAGSVWRRTKRAISKTKHGKLSEFKFSRVPHLTRVVAVRSNLFGTYAAIRSDSVPPAVQIDNTTFSDDIENLISFIEIMDDENDDIVSVVTDDSTSDRTRTRRPPKSSLNLMQLLQSQNHVQELDDQFEDLEMSGEQFDLYLASHEYENLLIPAHKVIVASRSEILMNVISGVVNNDDNVVAVDGIQYVEKNGKSILMFTNIGLIATIVLTYFMYTDFLVPVWEGFGSKANVPKPYLAAKEELIKIATILKIKQLSSAVYFSQPSPDLLAADITESVKDPRTSEWCDMTIQLQNGEEVKCHSAILSTRSPFFSTLTAQRWATPQPSFMLSGDYEISLPRESKPVDMKHVQSSVFQIVLDYMYGKPVDKLFDQIWTEDLAGFLEFVLDVLSISNELMTDKLTQVCQSILRSFVNVRNAAGLLTEADAYHADGLKKSLLEYLTMNLECALEDGYLNELDETLLEELEKVVRQKQTEKMPFSKSGILLEALEERNPSLREARRKELESLINNFDASSSLSSSFSSSYGSIWQNTNNGNLLSSLSGNFDRKHTSEPQVTATTALPSSRRNRRRSSTVVTMPSPCLQLRSADGNANSNNNDQNSTRGGSGGGDFIFDMDDEDLQAAVMLDKGEWTKIVKGKSRPLPQQMSGASSSFENGNSVSSRNRLATPVKTPPASGMPVTGGSGNHRQSMSSSPWATVSTTPKITPIDFKLLPKTSSVTLTQSSSVSSWTPTRNNEQVASGISLGLRNQGSSKNIGASEKLTVMQSPALVSAGSSWPKTPSATSSATIAPDQQNRQISSPAIIFDDAEVKMSQKERKKYRQQQQQLEKSAIEANAKAASCSAWQSKTPPVDKPGIPTTTLTATATTNNRGSARKSSSSLLFMPDVTSPVEKNFSGGPQTTYATVSKSSMSSSPSLFATLTPGQRKTSLATISTPPVVVAAAALVNNSRKSSPVPNFTGADNVSTLSSPFTATATMVPGLQWTLADIMEQQRIEQIMVTEKSAPPKKSFQELQAEEEFESWWQAESMRVQSELHMFNLDDQQQQQANKIESSASSSTRRHDKRDGNKNNPHAHPHHAGKGRSHSGRGRGSNGRGRGGNKSKTNSAATNQA
ncbi:hypothetical protein V1514DRAFT_342934 [Lipomyces japonicus]|uniref:uncharacterized protein n=1 Tax=Lipomyces japonicus TaxID=56871 RepID=UPI0034CE706D